MAAMSRAQRTELARQAREVRLSCRRSGMSVEETVTAILAELPDILPLEAWRLAHGWSRPKVLQAFFEIYQAEGLPEPSVDTVRLCRWEHGARAVPPECAHMLAKLYNVPLERLGLDCGHQGTSACHSPTGRRPAVTVRRPRAEDEGADLMRRRTLLTAAGLSIPLQVLQRVDDALAVPPAPQRPETPQQVRVRLQRAHHLMDVSALNALVAGFPELIASAREMADRVDTPAGFALLSECYVLTVRTFNKIGHRAAARLAAERALLIAERSGDPAAIGAASRLMGMLLRKERRFGPAARVMERAISGLEATRLRTSQQASTYLRLQCALAYTTGWAGKEQEALDRIGEIERAAGRLSTLAGPTMGVPVVRLYRANIHYALGDPQRALHFAERLRPQMFPTPERRARFWTDVARSAWAADKPEETTRALLGAIADAPGEVLERPRNRRIAEDLAARYPRVSGVRELTAAISPLP